LEGQLEAAQERLAALQHARRVLSLDSPVGLLTAVRRTTQPDGYAAEAALTQFADEPGVRKLIGALALERRRLATEIEARLKLIQCTRSGEDALIQIEAEPILYRKWRGARWPWRSVWRALASFFTLTTATHPSQSGRGRCSLSGFLPRFCDLAACA
jgi:hypothetical protein